MNGIGPTHIALHREWKTRGIVEETLLPDGRGTIARQDGVLVDATVSSGVLHSFPSGRERRRPIVELGPVIGEGGMGVVRVATQTALRRKVAVKELKEDAPLEAIAALMREAWVAGNLEHPNIVPIHALVGSQGAPLLVMKRIEGTDWSEVLHDPAAGARFGIGDPLEWHLQVLSQLCRAVHFAHSRGVLHLDLKPENVMLGSFGEVYLVDWGVAASLLDDPPDWMPRARDIRTVCGTPSCMAPEMAAADGARFSVRTDVYLLGAILHEIVTRRKRHEDDKLVDKLVSAFASDPPNYGPEVPSGLAEICRKAMARDPEDRHPDVESFRLALHDFLAHRSSARVVEAALERLERIRASATPGAAPEDALDEAELQRLYLECRFGLDQARETWPDNPTVPEAFQLLLESMVDIALRDRRAEPAAAWLDELAAPVPALEERLAALRLELQREEADRQELARIRHEADLNVHSGARARMSLLAGVVWLAWNLGAGAAVRTGVVPLHHATLVAGGFVTLALFAGGAWLFRRSVLRTEVNRRSLVLMGVGFLGVLALWVGCWHFAVPPLESVALSYLFYVQFPVALGLLVDRRVLLPGLAMVPFAVVAILRPAWAFEILGVMGALFGVGFAWVWRHPRRGDPSTDDGSESDAQPTW